MSSPAPLAAPSRILTGDEEHAYVAWATESIRRARLNAQWPAPDRVLNHLRAMSPDAHRGLYDGLQIQLPSGLPTYKEWTRVQSDAAIATQALANLPPRRELEGRAEREPGSIYAKQLAKHDYYGGLVGKPMAVLGDMVVQLRRVVPESNTAYFHVIFDKLDVSGLLVRHTIDLAQRSGVWNRTLVQLEEEHAEHTEELRTLIYRSTALDAEFMLVKLSALAGVVVERITKATIGPFFVDAAFAPPALAEWMRANDGSWVASFGTDCAAIDLAADRDNDPLDDMLADKLSDEGRAGYASARDKLQYKVFKDRKFVLSRRAQRSFKAWLRTQGTKNLVY